MGLIKKYKSGNTMNVSFNNNNEAQRKGLIAKADKNANGLNSDPNEQIQNSSIEANELFKLKKADYKPILEKRNNDITNANKVTSAASIAAPSGLSFLGDMSGILSNKASANAAKSMSKANFNLASGNYDDASKSISDATKASKNAQTLGKVSKGVGGAASTVGAIGAIKGMAAPVKDAIDSKLEYNKYGEATNNAQAIGKDWRTSDSDRMMQTWKENSDQGTGVQLGRTLIESAGFGKIGRTVSNAFGKQGVNEGNAKNIGDKFFAATNRMTGVTRNREKIDAERSAVDKNTASENARIAEEKRKYLGRAKDLATSSALSNNGMGMVFKKGGKLIPRFRRGGELDLEKENVILDGPSHDDHNSTGVKGDKGLPVVNKGVKVAEIESLELILNKKSSDEVEKLTNQYKKTGDKKILDKIGSIMKKEINDNTYDYSKELLK